MASLKETWRCLEGHSLLLQHYPESKREIIAYFREDQRDRYEEIYQSTLDFMAEILEELEPCVSPNRSLEHSSFVARNDTPSLSLKHLPPIRLPPFSGKADDWENFRDRFTALIIQNNELSDFARMHFLVSSLTEKARNVITSISVTADNFAVAWKALNSRFENKRKLVEIHVAELYNLPPVNRESSAELHSLRDKADRALSALKRLDRTSEDILNIFVYFVSLKLDSTTRRAWKLKAGSEAKPPNYDDLMNFISSRALVLEELSLPATNKGRPSIKANNATVSNNSATQCALCQKPHSLYKCSQFLSKSPSQRREFVKTSKRCFNCLGIKHSHQECKSKFTCRICQKKHHSLLHTDSVSSTEKSDSAVNTVNADERIDAQTASSAVAMSAIFVNSHVSSVLLATAKVTVRSPDGCICEARALIDQGSKVTFVSDKLANLLRLHRKRTLTQISAVGSVTADTCRHTAIIKIAPRGKDQPIFTIVAFILKSLTKYAPRFLASVADWQHLKRLPLADDDPTSSRPIDVIIGADIYGRVIQDGVRKGPIGQPIAQRSRFGWILSGPSQAPKNPPHEVNVLHCSLEQDLRRFWEMEEIPRRKILSPGEERCENHFLSTHSRTSDGRYVVRLLFKTTPPIEIGESRYIAIQRLTSLKRRLDAKSDIKSEYSAFFSEYEQLNHMQKVSPPVAHDSQKVYFPHHPVIRNTSTTTRLRVVFNASSLTENGTSLNSHLEVGPKLQTELISILSRWRLYKYVYTADIAKMYRQILVDPRDRDYQRIVWYNCNYTTVQDYQLSTVTYGTASAPFLALRVLKQLVQDEGAAFPLAVPILQDNTYVDDVLFGADDIPLLRQSRDQLCDLLSRGRFHLRKWTSNSSALLSDIPDECHGLAGKKILSLDESFSVLGLSWNPSCDAFQFQVTLPQSLPNTKRKILSTIAKLFDPLGWVTPVTINAKVFIQQLWRLKLNWDDVIPSQPIQRWETIYQSLSALNNLQIARWTGRGHDTMQCELHGNTASRAFENPNLFADSLNLDRQLIHKFKTILIALSCQLLLDSNRFEKISYATAELYVRCYPWYPMPSTVHKILMHGAEIISTSLLPVGMLGEEASEARNKDYKRYRKDHSRKHNRETNLEDTFYRIMDTSDPVVSTISLEKRVKNKKLSFPPDVIELFSIPDTDATDSITSEDEVQENLSGFLEFIHLNGIELSGEDSS